MCVYVRELSVLTKTLVLTGVYTRKDTDSVTILQLLCKVPTTCQVDSQSQVCANFWSSDKMADVRKSALMNNSVAL